MIKNDKKSTPVLGPHVEQQTQFELENWDSLTAIEFKRTDWIV